MPCFPAQRAHKKEHYLNYFKNSPTPALDYHGGDMMLPIRQPWGNASSLAVRVCMCMRHAYMDRVSKSAKRIQADASTLPSVSVCVRVFVPTHANTKAPPDLSALLNCSEQTRAQHEHNTTPHSNEWTIQTLLSDGCRPWALHISTKKGVHVDHGLSYTAITFSFCLQT